MISGESLDRLTAAIDDRLEWIAPRTGNVRLSADFATNAKGSIARFNGFADKGVDDDFHRGDHLYDREWHTKIWSFPNPNGSWTFDRPNITMYPISSRGPYYAIILGSGTLDTNGGPVVDATAQVVDTHHALIPGLNGAGNCNATPTGPYYYAGGGTLGPAVAFGYLAGKNAAKAPIKEVA